jgi:hypothetical protein
MSDPGKSVVNVSRITRCRVIAFCADSGQSFRLR